MYSRYVFTCLAVERALRFSISIAALKMSGTITALAATQLLDRNDPTLLTSKEINESYGNPENFFYAHGLKPFNPEDWETARSISRQLKAGMHKSSFPAGGNK